MYNALVPADTTSFGGYGFSYHAFTYGGFGWAFALILDLCIPPHIRPTGDDEDEEGEQKYDYEDQTAVELW